MSELTLRVLSAIVLIVVVLAATFMGGNWFAVFCVIAALLVMHEFLVIVGAVTGNGLRAAALAGIAIYLATWFLNGPGYALLALAGAITVVGAIQLFERRVPWAAIGLAYAALPFGALVLLRGSAPEGLHIILFLFACVWGSDTLAYFAGRTFGGPKLAPRISPKKTWSGFAGGVVGSVVISALVLLACGYTPGVAAVALAVVLSIVAQLGDLAESWLKRVFGIKDSGHIIPGHGGIMDRIDGLVTAAVVAWLLGAIIGGQPLIAGAPGFALLDAFVLP